MRKVGTYWVPDGPLTKRAEAQIEKGYRLDRLQMAMKHVDDMDMAVEVGAHIGTWTRELCRDFAHVLAIEPHAPSFEALKKNVEPYAESFGVEFVRCAVSDHRGRGSMTEDRKGAIAAKLIVGDDVDVDTLDNLCTMHGFREYIGYLKIHCNGFELEALRGAEKILNWHVNVVHVVMKTTVTTDVQAINEELLRHDYEIVATMKPDFIYKRKE